MSLKKIAGLAGTSVATVSRVLNHSEYHCRDKELEQRIWQAVRELNYTPNKAARKLKTGEEENQESLCFDVFLTRSLHISQDLFFSEIFDEIKKEMIRENVVPGRTLTLPEMTEKLAAPKQDHFTIQPKSRSADGLILLGKCPEALIEPLKQEYRNLVGIDRNPTNFAYDEVICNGEEASVKAMNYLIGLGHRKIAYIGDCSYEARYIGYYQTLHAHRIPLDYQNIYPTAQTRQEGEESMETILAGNNKPTAIFCANDSTAIGVLAALKRSKQRKYLPSVISMDNVKEAAKTVPALTTVDIPKKEMAHQAVRLILDRARGGHQECIRVELPSKLIERESCYLCI